MYKLWMLRMYESYVSSNLSDTWDVEGNVKHNVILIIETAG